MYYFHSRFDQLDSILSRNRFDGTSSIYIWPQQDEYESQHSASSAWESQQTRPVAQQPPCLPQQLPLQQSEVDAEVSQQESVMSEQYGGREGPFQTSDFYFWIGHFQSRISKIVISKILTMATFAWSGSRLAQDDLFKRWHFYTARRERLGRPEIAEGCYEHQRSDNTATIYGPAHFLICSIIGKISK